MTKKVDAESEHAPEDPRGRRSSESITNLREGFRLLKDAIGVHPVDPRGLDGAIAAFEEVLGRLGLSGGADSLAIKPPPRLGVEHPGHVAG
jgi:hypothetical protein